MVEVGKERVLARREWEGSKLRRKEKMTSVWSMEQKKASKLHVTCV